MPKSSLFPDVKVLSRDAAIAHVGQKAYNAVFSVTHDRLVAGAAAFDGRTVAGGLLEGEQPVTA